MNVDQLKSKFVAYKTECQLTLNSLEIKEKDYNCLIKYNSDLQKARILIA